MNNEMEDHEKTTGWGGPRKKSKKVKRIHDQWCRDNGYPVIERKKHPYYKQK
jgi:hypothetical protein